MGLSSYDKARRMQIASREKMINLKPLVNKLENVKKSKKVNKNKVSHSTNMILSGLAYLTNGGNADLLEVLHAVSTGAQEVVFNQSSKLRKMTKVQKVSSNLKKEKGTQLTSKNSFKLTNKNKARLRKYRNIYQKSRSKK